MESVGKHPIWKSSEQLRVLLSLGRESRTSRMGHVGVVSGKAKC